MTKATFLRLFLTFNLSFITLNNDTVSAQDLDSIKDDIFRDCPSALQDSSTLSPEAKRIVIEYSTRVLEIQKDSPRPKIYEPIAATAQPAYLNNNPANTLRRLELLKAYEPERDEEAKNCAIEILKSLVPYSFEATPRLIELCASNTYDQQHKDKIRKLVWQLALATKSISNYHLLTNTVSDLIQVASSSEGYLVDNILYELSDQALKVIVADLKKPARNKRANSIKMLLHTDPNGEIIGPLLLPYLNSSDDNLRLETTLLLGKLKRAHPIALQPIVDAINDPTTEVANAAYLSLSEILADKELANNYSGKETLLATLVTNLTSALPDRRNLILKSLSELVNYVSDPSPYILPLLQNKNDDSVLQGLKLTQAYDKKGINLINAVQDLLYYPSLAVRVEAISTLSQFSAAYAKDVTKVLTRLLKTLHKEADSAIKEELILQAVQASTALPANYSEGMLSYFIEALNYRGLKATSIDGESEANLNEKHPAVLAFVHLGTPSIPSLLKTLKSKDKYLKLRALAALKQLAPSTSEAIKQIASLLKDSHPQVQSTAALTLETIGMPAKPELQKALSYSDLNTRFVAAKALFNLGATNPTITLALAEGIKQQSCRDKSYLKSELKNLDIGIKTEMEDRLVNCLQAPGQEKEYFLDSLTELAPLEKSTITKTVAAINERKLSDDIILSLGEKGERLGISRIPLVAALQPYLFNPNNTNKARAISSLGSFGEDARLVLPDLFRIFNDQGQEDLIRHKALVAITKIEPGNLFYKKFLTDELATEKYQFALTTLTEMAPFLSFPLVAEAYDRLPEDVKPNALKTFERYPLEAKNFGNFIVAQLFSPNPLVRTYALSIIFKAGIPYPDLLSFLRVELLGKYSNILAEDSPPEPLMGLLKEVIAAPLSRTELRNTELLLTKINKKLGP